MILRITYGAAGRPCALLIYAVWFVCLSGCSAEATGPVSLASWQRSVEQYVWDHGNGDPTVLRDMSWDDAHRGFAVMTDPLPARSNDVIGLLVAHRTVRERPYFLFLVASVHRQVLEDLAPVALNVESGVFHWAEGGADAPAFEAYKKWSDSEKWLGKAGDPLPPPFPVPGDTFDLAVSGSRVFLRHPESGAVWEIDLSTATTKPAGAAGHHPADLQ